MMTSDDFVRRIKALLAYKTLYVNGAWGWPLNGPNKKRAIAKNAYNATTARSSKINAATADTFGFDCVCMIKGILWGWNGDVYAQYGGAGYSCNGVPDDNADQMIGMCETSTDWSAIREGAVVWLKGHIGVYVGHGLVIEATPIWEDGVQVTALNTPKQGYHTRVWTKWGLLPWVDYTDKEDDSTMSYETFKAYMDRYNRELAAQPADPYAHEALEWAKVNGIMLGDEQGNQRPQSVVKREDAVLMLYRADQLKG